MKTVASTLIYTASLIVISLIFTCLSDAKIDPETVAALWLFDEGKGDVAKDFSENGNDGELNGDPEWVDGKFGKALNFDGSTHYVEVPDSPSLDIEYEITIVAYVNFNQFKDQGIISKSQDGGGDGNYFLSTGCGGGASQAKFGVISSAGHTCGPASAVLKTGEWYHLAGVFDGSKLFIYVNGKEENTENHAGKITTSDWPIIIGSYAGLGYKLNAIVDELAIFNVAAEDHAGEITTSDGPIIIGSYAGTGYKSNVVIDELAIFNDALTEDDIKQIMAAGLVVPGAVSPRDKLSSTWAKLKVQY